MPEQKRSGPGAGAAPESSAVAGRHQQDSADPVTYIGPTDTYAALRFARARGCVCPAPVEVRLTAGLGTVVTWRHTSGCPVTEGGAA